MTTTVPRLDAVERALKCDVYPVWREHLGAYAHSPSGEVRLLMEPCLKRFRREMALLAPGFGPLEGLDGGDIGAAECAIAAHESKRFEDSLERAILHCDVAGNLTEVALVDFLCSLRALAKWGLDCLRMNMDDFQRAMNLIAGWNARGEPYGIEPMFHEAEATTTSEITVGTGEASKTLLSRCQYCPTPYAEREGHKCPITQRRRMNAEKLMSAWRRAQRVNRLDEASRKDIIRELAEEKDAPQDTVTDQWLRDTREARKAFIDRSPVEKDLLLGD